MSDRLIPVLLLSTSVLTGLTACNDNSQENTAKTSETAPKSQAVATQMPIGINLAAMMPSVKPGDDFYAYANGEWMKTTTIPADRSSTGSFLVAFEATEKHNTSLIAKLVNTQHAAGSDEARIANFYKAYTDTGAIDAAGMKPAEADIARFEAISSKQDLSAVLGANLRADVDPLNATDFSTENLFGIFVTQGLATPGEVLPYILQGGLGLPEREYYLSADPKMAEIRTAYRAYIETLLKDAGVSDAAARADRIFALEHKIAAAHASREASEDFVKSSGVWSRADFDTKAPGIDWAAFWDAAQLGNQPKFAAYHATAISGLSALVASEPLNAWKDWLVFHHINSHADVLPSNIEQAAFAFNGTKLSGTPEQRSRDKLALSALDQYLGDAVGHAYVEQYFPASAKAEVSTMVDNIVAAFGQRVEKLDWMDPSTKKEALAKVATIAVGVGYPDKWRNYDSYTVSATNTYANAINGEKVEYAHQLAKIGKPMDKGEWWMTPQVVNAVNLPVQNALNFPAGILQPPFFDAKADAAYNYGAIGAVIGHEISHSFDNNGAAFDSTGAMRNWWTPADFAQFAKQGDALAQQFDAYAPFPDLHVNGKLTLGENIADVAGLAAALDAYHASLNGKEAPVIEGFSGDQRFFIGFAQTWATKMRDEALRARVATDGHAPGMYRALTVRNLDAWYSAFDVKPGDKLYLAPEDRVKIW
ncbi:M13 family metallopeptidase [Shewanella glacialipiscicola]|uniref:Peptidase M13 n=1 Tax=Shewanella glacialipiscicola TaxID=614069 RepID=A0ABQ6IXP2_9GAMM|nr:M13 family metallopeptidase [Shewanella glacialipiscicola]MCL1086672.1 M13 family metallopeptidase [Shewanella glacialipiscicola]GIU18433.1 peptidase M13 [Shewanella glacialipiscicola]GMA80636.1 peptidase M13 [Shewanella glacialipiscicola]